MRWLTGSWRVRCTGLVVGSIFAVPLCMAGMPHRLECPLQAPADWKLPQPAPLVQAAVLSQPNGEPIDESAPPTLVPDQGFAHGDVWHNVWLMGDEPNWSHYIDCRYRGSKRVLRLRADGLKRCEQTARPYSARTGVANNAVQTMTCD